ncbi:MAG: methylated-DNA--[protein]-cysteine S-methyltransferase [Dehalococcoidales bacterium]
MANESSYTVFHTAAGWVGILSSGNGLRRVTLPQRSEAGVYRELGNPEQATLADNGFSDLKERLQAYFAGEQIDFPDTLDFSGATPFQRDVWRITRLIPYGRTRSYQWVAAQTGRPGAARAVGQALGKNPFPIIVPCHRVVASNGGLGGYSGGIEMKRFLLSLEKSVGIR